MSLGNKIVLSPDPQGIRLEGTLSGTPSPGTILEIKASVTTLVNGRPTYQVYQPGTDGDRRPIIVLIPNPYNGQLATAAYVDGDHIFMYVPQAGEEMNMLVADVAGTADDHSFGEIMIVDSGTGKLIATTGSPESEPFQLLETITDPVADTLAWCWYTGY